MGVTFLLIPIALGIVVIISALASFAFIFRRLKINHIIKKLLLFATVQQAIGFGIFVSSNISHASGFKNKLTCFLAITSVRASVIGTQTSISAISIIRYFVTDRTQNNRVFDDVKILTLAALSLIINYAFVIGTSILAIFTEDNWDLEHDTKCVKLNGFTWIVIWNSIYYCVLTISGIFADIALHSYLIQKQNTGHGDTIHELTITPWRVSSNQESNYITNVPINATLIGAAATTVGTSFIIFRSLFSESDTITRVIYIGGLVPSMIQIPLVLAFTIKHHKKTSQINPVVPKMLQFHEDEHDFDNISNGVNDETTNNDGNPIIVTHVNVYDHVESVDNADENSDTVGNCEYLELTVSNERVKLTEIGEASGQLPGKVCHM